jgi:hypothetical protein
MKDIQNIMDDVIQEVTTKRQEVVITEPEPEKVESLDDLLKGWEEAKPKAEDKKKPNIWNMNAKPLEKKEEVYSYFTRRIITGPYLCIILEHVFSVPHEMAYEIEAELTKDGLDSGFIPLRDKIIAEVELWKRVLAKCERDKIEGDFYEDAHKILGNRLSELNIINAHAEKMEIKNGEESVRKSCKGWKKF